LTHWDGDQFTFTLRNENANPGTISKVEFSGTLQSVTSMTRVFRQPWSWRLYPPGTWGEWPTRATAVREGAHAVCIVGGVLLRLDSFDAPHLEVIQRCQVPRRLVALAALRGLPIQLEVGGNLGRTELREDVATGLVVMVLASQARRETRNGTEFRQINGPMKRRRGGRQHNIPLGWKANATGLNPSEVFILRPADHHLCFQSRKPIDMMVHG
jgi:hypothetical protein